MCATHYSKEVDSRTAWADVASPASDMNNCKPLAALLLVQAENQHWRRCVKASIAIALPHGGIAAGIDRIVMLLVGAKNLREISLFLMNQLANDLLMGAPSEATAKQLRELSIKLSVVEREK
jgi:aspartyl-tRNA synthetase